VARRQDLGERLKAVPVAALRLGEEAVGADALDGLQRVGLRRLGDLYGLPRAALAARFGAGVASALDRLLGHARQPIAPRRPASRYRVRLAFPDPIGQRGDIDAGVTRVVHHLCTRLEAEDLGCRHLLLQLWRADGTGQTIPLGFARPVRAPADILRLLAEKLGTVEPGFGIDCLILDAPRVEAFESTQLTAAMPPADGSLAGNKPSSPGLARGYADSDALASLADRLANRLGHDNLFRLSPTDSRLPDAAQTKRRPVARRGVPDKPGDWPQTAARPMSLLACPQPLMPLGAPKAGDPLLAFRYKGRRVAIRVAVGPERIAPDWWREDAAWAAGARDYWRVEDEEGQRFWIYRDAVAGPLADTAGTVGRQPWYLHGVFG
jgi:protein ImuB